MSGVFETLTEIVRDLFDEYEGPVTRELSAKDVPQWDSLAHVQLIALVEQRCGVRFSASEIHGLANLGDLWDAVQRKKNA